MILKHNCLQIDKDSNVSKEYYLDKIYKNHWDLRFY